MDAVIKISGVQGLVGGTPETVELITDGLYSRTERGFEISYEESELTGLFGTATRVEVSPDGVTVERKGTLNTKMEFKPGEHCNFLYDTQFGAAVLGVDTRKINAELDDHGGELCIDYVVNMEHAVVSRNKLIMSVKTRS